MRRGRAPPPRGSPEANHYQRPTGADAIESLLACHQTGYPIRDILFDFYTKKGFEPFNAARRSAAAEASAEANHYQRPAEADAIESLLACQKARCDLQRALGFSGR